MDRVMRFWLQLFSSILLPPIIPLAPFNFLKYLFSRRYFQGPPAVSVTPVVTSFLIFPLRAVDLPPVSRRRQKICQDVHKTKYIYFTRKSVEWLNIVLTKLRPLFRPRLIYVCQQWPSPSHETVHLMWIDIKGAQVWDIRSLGFSWFLHHKVFLGRWFGGKNINLLF
jgi:hypothetical protein